MKEFSGNFKSVAIVLLFGLVCGLSAENPAQNQGTKAQIKDVSVEEAANEGKRPVTFTVVLPNQPSATEEFAAGELASYLKKMTGREPNRIAENEGRTEGRVEDGRRVLNRPRPHERIELEGELQRQEGKQGKDEIKV